MKNIKPIFEYEHEDEFSQKVMRLVEDKLAEQKQKSAKDKLDEIRKSITEKATEKTTEKTFVPSVPNVVHEHHIDKLDALDCPSCKGHSLTVKEDTAKCNGPGCGKEFLLVEKVKDAAKDRKKYLCTTCGHGIGSSEVELLKKKDACPSCGIGKSFVDINWNVIEQELKNKSRLSKI